MNKTVEDLITRRSVRKFKDHPVPKELLDQVIEAGLYAPSGRNFQSSIIIAVSNPELRNRIAEINCRIGGWAKDFDPFYGAPTILIVLGDKSRPNYLYDGSLTMGNLMNAAHAVGLGSCWIHRAREEFETEEFKELLKSLGDDNRFIRRIFITDACMLVLKGMFWGNVLALALCAVQYFTHILPLDAATYYVSSVPVAFPWGWLLLLNIGILVVSFLVLLAPSAIVTRISPARVMHFE